MKSNKLNPISCRFKRYGFVSIVIGSQKCSSATELWDSTDSSAHQMAVQSTCGWVGMTNILFHCQLNVWPAHHISIQKVAVMPCHALIITCWPYCT